METPLLTLLLLLCLTVPGHCDCQRDCLSCRVPLPEKQVFSTLACLVECKERASLGLTWDLCHRYGELLQPHSLPVEVTVLKKGMDEAPTLTPMDLESGGQEFSEALERFHHAARALGLDGTSWEAAQILDPRLPRQLRTEEEEGEGGAADEDDGDREDDGKLQEAAISLSKRFGGFLKGKYGYRKLMGPGRSLQKRYGGFIGIRKSARKWHNQKRFSELLKQYLGMRTRPE
ncbi:prepronociceptin b [Paramormyrops kingsleyae]|uniref:Prepronociceptin n=1 Tax=Paramormyrops kingsleyae TaxID=1676925 RepID=A0A3B3QH54_9TELE|nr:prepronociceptin [Paramormyrops kingsleyae]